MASILLVWACGLRAQEDLQTQFTLLEAQHAEMRKTLQLDDLLGRYRAIFDGSKDASLQARAAARLSELVLEKQLLNKLGTRDQWSGQTPSEIALALTKESNNAEEELALARFCFFHGRQELGEDALGRARDANPELKDVTDRLLSAARGEAMPRGGYHRYRLEWLTLAERDRRRALDESLEKLDALKLRSIRMPIAIQTTTSNAVSFGQKLKTGTSAFLRDAAAQVRHTLEQDYAEIRKWLSSYARLPSLRQALLDKREEMRKVQAQALTLIARYDKPQQPQVDTFRKQLSEMYREFTKLLDRDRQVWRNVARQRADEILHRLRTREEALAATHRYLSSYHKPGLEPASITPATGAQATTRHVLPGREQSGLEDVLWFLLHHRADRLFDTTTRGNELLRQRAALTPWEILQIEEALFDAVETYNHRVATSLDEVEMDFVVRLNQYRRILGLRPFELEERCNVGSRKHSQEMIDLGYFGHISPLARNRGPSDRVRLESYNGGVGENCLGGHVNGSGAFEGWYHSPGHHRNLVSRGIHLGVGAVANHSMWTMVCGGSDLSWRTLHGDLSAKEHEKFTAIAQEFAKTQREEPRTKKTRARQQAALESAKNALPGILTYVAQLALPATRSREHSLHRAHPALLAFIADAEVHNSWRPLQIAAIAAAIESLRHTSQEQLREAVFALVSRYVQDDCGFDPTASEKQRRESVFALMRHWEDEAIWKFHQAITAKNPKPPFKLPGRVGDGPSLRSPRKVLSKRERLRIAKQHGGSSKTETAIENGLAFLAKIQDEDGAWRARSFVSLSPKFDRHARPGSGEWEIAMTGLALLAFTSAGHTTDQGDYPEVVSKGAAFLCAQILDYGRFETTASHYMYNHSIAVQALSELYSFTADPHTGVCAQLATDYLVFAQHQPSGGWRYEANQFGDTSVSGWAILALNSAFKADLHVAGFRGALRFLDHVTQSGYYQVGYQNPGDWGSASNRLGSVAMVARQFLGARKNDPKIVLHAHRLKSALVNPRAPDFYHWYYATLGMFQMGGDFWKKWNAAFMPALLNLQIVDRSSPYFGSWNPDRQHGRHGGRVYQTAMGVLMLTTYYRYDRAPKNRFFSFTGDIAKETKPFLDAFRTLNSDANKQALVRAQLVDHFGPSLAPVLLRILREGKEDVALRRKLAAILIDVVEPRNEMALLELLTDKDNAIAILIMKALARVSSANSASTLERYLNHGHRDVRGYAAQALGDIGNTKTITALSQRLSKERDKWCKSVIQKAMRKLTTRKDTRLFLDDALPAKELGRLEILKVLDLLEGANIGKHLVAIKKSEPALYARCTQALNEYRTSSGVPILLALLESEAAAVRTDTVKLLRAITGKNHKFQPDADKNSRRSAVGRWHAWWRQHQAEYIITDK